MTSQQQGSNLETCCKDCVFAEYDGITQIGCKAHRLNLFNSNDIIEAKDEEKEFFVIKKLCQYYRPPGWQNEENDLERVVDELKPTVSVIIDVTEFKEEAFDALDVEIDNIFSWKNTEVIIVHPHTFKHKERTKNLMLRFLGKQNIKFVEYNDTLKSEEVVLEGLKNVTKTFFVFYQLGLKVSECMKLIQESIIKGERIVSAQSDKGLFIMSSVLKFFITEENVDFDKFENGIVSGAKSSAMHLEL